MFNIQFCHTAGAQMQSTHTAVCLEGMAGHLWIKFLQKMLFLHSCLPPSLVLGTSKMCIHAERLIIAVSINNNNNNNNNNSAITITIMHQ